MNKKKFVSIIMTVLMVISLLPSFVYAAVVPSGKLDGKLKVNGTAAVGFTLSADYKKVTPEGVTDDYVAFQWVRKQGEELTDVGTERTYTVTEEDLGSKIILKITGEESLGVTGELTAVTNEITETEEEALAILAQQEAENESEEESEEISEDIEAIEEIEEIPEGTEAAEGIEAAESIEEAEETEVPDEIENIAYDMSEIPEEYEVYEEEYETYEDTSVDEEIQIPAEAAQDEQTEEQPWDEELLMEIPEATEDGTIQNAEEPETENPEIVPVQIDDVTEEPQDEEPQEQEEDPQEQVTLPVYQVSAAPAEAVFETVKEGYTEAPAAQTITVTNYGTESVSLKQPTADAFEIGELSAQEVAPGESVTFTIQPKTGLTEGQYAESIVLYADTAEADSQTDIEPAEEGSDELDTVTAQITVEKEEPVYSLSVTPETLDFGICEEGYEAPAAQTVTITNKGNTEVNLEQPQGGEFSVGELSQTVLEPGESAFFTVNPTEGLETGEYLEVITIPNNFNIEAFVNAEFYVSEAEVRLISVGKAGSVTGLESGVEKSAEGLELPGTVNIRTTEGKTKASVKWDVKGCAYNPSSTDYQSFTVNGTVVLPDGVTNPDNISLIVSCQVSVEAAIVAAHIPVVPSPSENVIIGIDANGTYTTETKITFTAVGAGMDNEEPGEGDVRYVPLNWRVLETRVWDQAPYTATFRMGQSGSYTLSVVYNKQEFDGSNWFNTGDQDTRQVSFTVISVTPTITGQDLTPAPNQTDANQKSAVKTGDDTKIAPFIILVIVAAACIIGVVVYRKKKK